MEKMDEVKGIWKYQLKFDHLQVIEMPIGAQILTVQMQNELPFMWALVNPIGSGEKRFIETVFTGQRLYDVDNMKYLGTYQLHSDSMVFHVFERVIFKPK